MKYDLCKFEKGQVWMVLVPEGFGRGHEQKKSRPWVVLSSGKFNSSSNLVTMAPVSTRDTVRSPAQVLFEDFRGKHSVVMVEGVRTFDYTSPDYKFDFMGNLSQEVMTKVDLAVTFHFGLHFSPLTLSEVKSVLEDMILSVSELNNERKFTERDVLDFATEVRDLVVPQKSTVTESVAVEPEPVEEATPVESGAEVSEEKRGKRTRRKWTREKGEEFLEDSKKLPMKEVMAKWGISKKSAYYQTLYYVRDQVLN